MAAPTPYSLAYDFTAFQTGSPTTPLPADKIEIEFNALQTTTDEIIANLGLIQRSDGQIANDSVGQDQLKDEVTLSVNTRGNWATATVYAINDVVYQNNNVYRCLISHTSDTFSTDLAALKWELFLNFDQFITPAESAQTAAETAQTASEAAQSYAEEWANKAEDSLISVAAGGDGATEYSALHWANKAAASAAVLPLNNFVATTAPTVGDDSDDGYSVGSRWVDLTADEAYLLVDATVGAAVWIEVTLQTAELGALAVLNTVNDSNWSGTDLSVANGGTGVSTLTAYAPIFGGTTGTGAVQSGTVGTSGQVLTSNGAGALPTFQAASGGMGVILGSYTASNATSVDIGDGLDLDAVIDGTYDVYEIEGVDVIPATDGTFLYMRTSANTGVSFDTGASDYEWAHEGRSTGGSNRDGNDTAAAEIRASDVMGSDAGESSNVLIRLYNPAGTNFTKVGIKHDGDSTVTTDDATFVVGVGRRNSAAIVDAVRLLASSGNISGTFYLRGYKTS